MKATKSFFEEIQSEQLKTDYIKIIGKNDKFLTEALSVKFFHEDAQEFFNHGFCRRLKTLKRCTENVFEICPPDEIEKLEHDLRVDLEINIQAFIVNVYGAIDNLLWVWVKETGFKYKNLTKVALGNPELIETFSPIFVSYLESLEGWFSHLLNFRHSLAHRIPLYVPPYALTPEEMLRDKQIDQEIFEALKNPNVDFNKINDLNEEQEKLGVFIPVYRHSFSENSPEVILHAQILADNNTVFDIAEKFKEELERYRSNA